MYNVDPMLLDFAPAEDDDLPVEQGEGGDRVRDEAQLHGSFPSSSALDKGAASWESCSLWLCRETSAA